MKEQIVSINHCKLLVDDGKVVAVKGDLDTIQYSLLLTL